MLRLRWIAALTLSALLTVAGAARVERSSASDASFRAASRLIKIDLRVGSQRLFVAGVLQKGEAADIRRLDSRIGKSSCNSLGIRTWRRADLIAQQYLGCTVYTQFFLVDSPTWRVRTTYGDIRVGMRWQQVPGRLRAAAGPGGRLGTGWYTWPRTSFCKPTRLDPPGLDHVMAVRVQATVVRAIRLQTPRFDGGSCDGPTG